MAALLELAGQVVGEDRLAGAIRSVDRDDQAPTRVVGEDLVRQLIDERAPLGRQPRHGVSLLLGS